MEVYGGIKMKAETSCQWAGEGSGAENYAELPSDGIENIIGVRRQPVHKRWAFLHLSPLLRVAWSEVRILPNRIRMRNGKESSPLDAGRLYLRSRDGHLLPNNRTRGRIECIRKVASSYPWTTSADWRISLDAWDQGVEWAVRTLGSDSTLSEEHKALLGSEVA
jgi:hypothetical protein